MNKKILIAIIAVVVIAVAVVLVVVLSGDKTPANNVENSVENTVENSATNNNNDSKNTVTATHEFSEKEANGEGKADKKGNFFIPKFENPDSEMFEAVQSNANIGVDNDLNYLAENREFTDSGISVRVFAKTGTYANIDEYIAKQAKIYTWKKEEVAGKTYDIFVVTNHPNPDARYSRYYRGVFMVGDKVIEFEYTMHKEVPNQEYGDKFFNTIIDSIQYSSEYKTAQ